MPQPWHEVPVLSLIHILNYIDSQHSAALADTAQALQDIFDAITHQIAVTATVSDMLDSRFELTAEQKAAFDTAGVAYTENGDGTTTIVWPDKDLSGNGWQVSIEVKAKDSFIGDNNVPTNAAGSGAVSYTHLDVYKRQPGWLCGHGDQLFQY